MTTPSLETVYIGRGWSVMSSASLESNADPGLLEGQTPSSTTCMPGVRDEVYRADTTIMMSGLNAGDEVYRANARIMMG